MKIIPHISGGFAIQAENEAEMYWIHHLATALMNKKTIIKDDEALSLISVITDNDKDPYTKKK